MHAVKMIDYTLTRGADKGNNVSCNSSHVHTASPVNKKHCITTFHCPPHWTRSPRLHSCEREGGDETR